MKGKIYKNKLNATTTNQHLHTDISSISPLSYGNHLHQPNSPGSHLLSPKNNKQLNRQGNVAVGNRNSSTNNNNKRSFIHELFAETVSSNNNNNNRGVNLYANQQPLNNFMDQFSQQNSNFITQMNSPTHHQNLLKRVVSNPNLTSCQFLAAENREDEIDAIDEASIMDKSSHNNSLFNNNYLVNNNNTSKLTSIGIKNSNYPVFADPVTQTRPLSHLPSGYNSPAQNRPQSPLFQTSNLMYYQNQPSHPKPVSQTDYITAYQKRHKQRISALQSQHELQIQFYEDELKGRNETIQEMRRLLREKEDIIKKLQSENASLSSRSYVSFANGGNHHYAGKAD